MKKVLTLLAFGITISLSAAEPATALAPVLNTTCPISGKPANPAITSVYEGRTYAFADDTSKSTFDANRTGSLYHQLGGKAAIEAAVELFYVKVLADPRVNAFFADISMAKQKRKQIEFLSAALGGPIPYTGKDLHSAHVDLDINDSHFDAIAEHLQATLTELKVDPALIGKVMTIVGSTRGHIVSHSQKQ